MALRKRKKSTLIIIVVALLTLSIPVTLVTRLRSQAAEKISALFSNSAEKIAKIDVQKKQIERLKSQNLQLME